MAKFTKSETLDVRCPGCQSAGVRKHGVQTGSQRYRCQSCKRVFRHELPSGRRVKPDLISAAIDMYFDGLSYKRVAENLATQFGIPEPSKQSIHAWVSGFPPKAAAIERTGQKPKTGDEWAADELQVVVGGRPMWLWNVMDAKTRFLLVTHLAPHRSAREATVVMRKAREAAATRPDLVKAERLRSYDQGMANVWAGDSVVKHVKSDGIRAEVNNNMSERLQGTFRDRLKILRGLKSAASGQRYPDGWAFNYNYFRPHMALNQSTPGKRAGVNAPFATWQDVAREGLPAPQRREHTIKRQEFAGPRRRL